MVLSNIARSILSCAIRAIEAAKRSVLLKLLVHTEAVVSNGACTGGGNTIQVGGEKRRILGRPTCCVFNFPQNCRNVCMATFRRKEGGKEGREEVYFGYPHSPSLSLSPSLPPSLPPGAAHTHTSVIDDWRRILSKSSVSRSPEWKAPPSFRPSPPPPPPPPRHCGISDCLSKWPSFA